MQRDSYLRKRLTKASKLICGLLLLCNSLVGTAENNMPQPKDCLGCHLKSADQPVHSVMLSKHGQALGSGSKSCISCHGESKAHSTAPKEQLSDLNFDTDNGSSTQQQNQLCIGCHATGSTLRWMISTHEDESLSCTSCHTIHQQQDPALAKDGQNKLCYQCHSRQRSEAQLPSRHPIKEGNMLCSDCHNPHGTTTKAALKEPTLNDTCFNCHAEKRGPHLFEHPPVAEDCSICHKAHGSVNDDLLRGRGPFLCQQCHSAAFHPSVANSGSGLANQNASQNLLGKNCMNCHSQVHGSNHPSGARLTR